jgi:hypothetical protein
MLNDLVNRCFFRCIFFSFFFPIAVGQAVPIDSNSNTGMYEKYKGDQQKFLDDFAGARPNINKEELVPLIFSTLQRLTRYPLPDQYPTVTYLSSDDLSKLACDSKCTVLGHYQGGLTVYLDDKLKPESNLFDRSVLLHEMVHYLQQLNLPASKSELSIHEKCVLWYTREREAYAVQEAFLIMVASPVRAGYFPARADC